MASGDTLPVEKEWQQIQEEITCSICRELFTDPKTISCLHTFCKQCIEKSLESNKKMGSIVCCPLCRTPFPREGVSFVPTNFTINRLVEIFRKRKESGKSLAPKELRCGSCETVNLPAVMWCMDCSNSFCVECKDAHNRLKAFKSHATVAVDEFLKNPKLVLSTSEKPEVCRSHVKQALDLYCKTCSSLICRDCTLKDHPRETHDFDFIDDIVDKEREKIKKATAPLEPLLKQVRNGIKRIEKIDKDIDVKSETNRRKIKGVYGEVYKLLKQQQKEALQKVNTIKTSLKKKLAMQKETVKFMESQLVSCMEFSNDAISTNRTRQLLTYKNSIIDRVEILTKQVEHANMDPECRADDMMVRCAKPAEFISDSLCDVSGIPNLPHCGVWGPLAISDPVKVTVSLKDFCGFPVVGQSKDIEIRCNKEVGFLQNVRIEEEANGQYHIWYKPKRKEDHLLFVYWRGLVVNDNMPVNIRSYDNIKEVVKLAKFNFSTPRQHHPKAARAVSSVASPIISVPPKVSLPTFLPSTQVLSLSGSSTSVKSNSEHKQLPMKTDSCLDILKSSKPPVGEKTVEDSTQSKPPAPSSSSSQKFKPAEGSWECPTCMIYNKITDDKCVACTTSRPGSAPTATNTTTAAALTSNGQLSDPPVNPLLTTSTAHIMTLPSVAPLTNDCPHSFPITMITIAQPTTTHSSEPHPQAALNTLCLSSTAPGLLASNVLGTSEKARVKEKPQDVNQPVSEDFTTGLVGVASGKIMEKKHSMHQGNNDDGQINPMETPKAIPLHLSSNGKLPSFSFTPPHLQKKSSLSQKFKPFEGSWECPTCMIYNKTTDDKCVACTTSRPGNAPTATTATALSSIATSRPGFNSHVAMQNQGGSIFSDALLSTSCVTARKVKKSKK